MATDTPTPSRPLRFGPATLVERAGAPFRRRPLVTFAAVGLVGMIVIATGSLIASRRAGETEAMAEVRMLTAVVATTVVEPNLSADLVAGDADAIASLDRVVRERVLSGSTVRVKLWDASGTIVYSDEARLIGEQYDLDDDKTTSLWTGEVVSELSTLSGPENRFEAADHQRLLEVYLPLAGPDGPLLYESYFAETAISDSSSRIWREFVPIIVIALVVTEAMHLALTWGLSRRLARSQAERERLLQRAIDASDAERRRIAADIHDGVVQDLVATSFAVTAAAETARRCSPELAVDLRHAAVGTRRSLQALRSLLVDIYPPNLQAQGLESALADLLAPAASLGIETELTVVGDVDTDTEAAALVYRVSQESVRNALHHAEASELALSVEALDTGLVAWIGDNGRGFETDEPAEHGHFGLRVLTDLAKDAGAYLFVDSKPGEGTTVHLEVPA